MVIISLKKVEKSYHNSGYGRFTIYNATLDGFEHDNQASNSSYDNNFDISVLTCGQTGLSIGKNCSSSNIRATISSAVSYGCTIGTNTAHPSFNINLDLTTRNCGAAGLYINVDGNDNIIRHCSNLDGRTGAQGTSFAVDVSGNRNKLIVNVIDSVTWQVRGVAFRAGATSNELLSYTYTNTADPYNDAGTTTSFNRGNSQGADISSIAGTITLPIFGSSFRLLGTASVTSITASSNKGREVKFIIDTTASFADGSNLKLASLSPNTADDTISMLCDGTNWYETGRSVN